jgi:hypothetical protein
VHTLTDAMIPKSIPEIVDFAVAGGRQLDMELVLVPVGESAESALSQLPPDVEAVYLTPLNRMTEDELQRLIDGLIDRRIPSFSLIGRAEVEQGVLAGSRPSMDYGQLARRIASNIQRILLGEDAGQLPAVVQEQGRLTINVATAAAIGYPIRWHVLTRAETVGEDQLPAGDPLTLDEAVSEALASNLNLRVRLREVAAAAENINRARARLRPSIEAAASAVRIDEDNAAASFGSVSENTVNGSLGLRQLVFSDALRADLTITRFQQSAFEMDLDGLRLDVALDTAVAFLDVLRAETTQRIERDNLRLTESNLELARRRLEIGFSGPADVYRFESQLATDSAVVVAAVNRTAAARLRLNQLMNRPQEESFRPVAPTLIDPMLISGFARLAPFLETPTGAELFVRSHLPCGAPLVLGAGDRLRRRHRSRRVARRRG